MRPENLFSLTVHGRQRDGAVRLLQLLWITSLARIFSLRVVEGHPISVSEEGVYVTRDRVLISIQIYLEDL